MVSGSASIAVNLNGCEKLTVRACFAQGTGGFAYSMVGIGGARLSHFPAQNENA